MILPSYSPACRFTGSDKNNCYLFLPLVLYILKIFKELTWMKLLLPFIVFITFGCGTLKIKTPVRSSGMTGSEFYETAAAYQWQQRDSLVVKEILSGNIPSFLKKFVCIEVGLKDSVSGKKYKAHFFAAPDYLSVGTDHDWARINITPYAAQVIADSLNCFLPTRKMVDDIYKAAKIKLEPVPLYAFRDSTPTMYHHHLLIEGQRKGRKGLIAGIKKDVVLSGRISRDKKADRVAIYGWHKMNGNPIQPLYTGHAYWWVDYSQGIRLVYRKIRVNGKWMDYTEMLKDLLLQRLICDEEYCDFNKYRF